MFHKREEHVEGLETFAGNLQSDRGYEIASFLN